MLNYFVLKLVPGNQDPSVFAQIIDLIPQLNLLMQLRLFISQ